MPFPAYLDEFTGDSGDRVAQSGTVTTAASVQDVVKRIRDGRERRTVIDRVSFDVDRGEIVILRGPSGSGKTTLLALVGAMLSPTSGEVHLDGEPTSRLRDAHRAAVRRKKVGFVFQDVQLVDTMTARDNVLLPCVPDG
ncbi:MAG: Cell division transporter, ATP-binding protein FtsE [Myxococcaceae bacterium]|nr:Cell division transporter, ATP-binding protein FtsE [Myxococcaceae bacterium]